MIFIGLEISSIATYVLAGYLRDDKRNNEAGSEVFPAGFVRHRVSAVRQSRGSTASPAAPIWSQSARSLRTPAYPSGAMLVGTAAALMFVGFAFKVSAAPFQIWAPDVYQGAPAPVTLFMSAGSESRGVRGFPARLHDRASVRSPIAGNRSSGRRRCSR